MLRTQSQQQQPKFKQQPDVYTRKDKSKAYQQGLSAFSKLLIGSIKKAPSTNKRLGKKLLYGDKHAEFIGEQQFEQQKRLEF